ncbi:hypothetical protein GCM10023310_70630 [Paenibacillus vulneris]|uniref:DUF6710 family protein n=1 Tax=Paenibacillus vulneris TaxID=1133364 RepID=A0ABW3UG59_9BACL
MFNNFFNKNKTSKVSGSDNAAEVQQQQFTRMISMAQDILKNSDEHTPSKEYKHPIFNFIKLLGMKMQTDYLTYLLYADDYGETRKYPDITPWHTFFDISAVLTLDGKKFYDILFGNKLETQFKVDLTEDLVLPWPWNVDRYVTSITSIGSSRPWGEWEEDSNHRVDMYLPLGICFVRGGNHSITSGIISGKGTVTTSKVYDISLVYDYVYTDGIYYRRTADNSIISSVQFIEFAVIFEIGRMLRERKISR